MNFEILTYGHAALRKKAVPVKKISPAIRQLASDMLEAMYEARGLGLAAEQVGRTEAMCVIHIPAELDARVKGALRDNPTVPMPMVLINPLVIAEAGEQSGQEGCLSFPEIFVTIRRPEVVTVSFTDVDGRGQTVTVRGLLARAVLHELDHLNAVLLVDRMSPIQKLTVATKLKRLKKQRKLPSA